MSRSDGPDSPYRRILFCTDFSQNADFAFDFAVDAAARRPGAVLFLLHVIPEPEAQFWKTYLYELDEVDAKARADVDARIAAAYLPRVPAGLDLHVHVRTGKEHAEILDFARRNAIDLIVVGRQGRSALGEILFGGVADKVARKAECPVLIVPMRAGSQARKR